MPLVELVRTWADRKNVTLAQFALALDTEAVDRAHPNHYQAGAHD